MDFSWFTFIDGWMKNDMVDGGLGHLLLVSLFFAYAILVSSDAPAIFHSVMQSAIHSSNVSEQVMSLSNCMVSWGHCTHFMFISLERLLL